MKLVVRDTVNLSRGKPAILMESGGESYSHVKRSSDTFDKCAQNRILVRPNYSTIPETGLRCGGSQLEGDFLRAIS